MKTVRFELNPDDRSSYIVIPSTRKGDATGDYIPASEVEKMKKAFKEVLAQLEPKDIGYTWEEWDKLEQFLKEQ